MILIRYFQVLFCRKFLIIFNRNFTRTTLTLAMSLCARWNQSRPQFPTKPAWETTRTLSKKNDYWPVNYLFLINRNFLFTAIFLTTSIAFQCTTWVRFMVKVYRVITTSTNFRHHQITFTPFTWARHWSSLLALSFTTLCSTVLRPFWRSTAGWRQFSRRPIDLKPGRPTLGLLPLVKYDFLKQSH